MIGKIDHEDDLLHYSIGMASEMYSRFRYYRGAWMYFFGGDFNATELEDLLADLGVSLRDADSVLEFACGYGRVTRHLVRRVDPAKITVSDIDRRAVDFVCHTFGVNGFYSASSPEELAHNQRYDLIIVVSLFSHLPMASWERWLRRLYDMLTADGLLVFSTLPLDTGSAPLGDEQREVSDVGFLYHATNETRGRLATEQYGVASVDLRFVSRAVAQSGAGSLVKYLPRGLNGVQDVYVLRRSGEPQDGRLTSGAYRP